MEVPGKEILKEVPQIWETNPVCFLLFVDFSFDFFIYSCLFEMITEIRKFWRVHGEQEFKEDRMCPQPHIFECPVPTWGNYLGSIRRYGLCGGGMSLGCGFWNSKTSCHSEIALAVLNLWIRCKLSVAVPGTSLPVCCHAPRHDGHVC